MSSENFFVFIKESDSGRFVLMFDYFTVYMGIYRYIWINFLYINYISFFVLCHQKSLFITILIYNVIYSLLIDIVLQLGWSKCIFDYFLIIFNFLLYRMSSFALQVKLRNIFFIEFIQSLLNLLLQQQLLTFIKCIHSESPSIFYYFSMKRISL